jgi:hypothetical protein
MSALSLPIRIRPNRVRLFLYICVLSAFVGSGLVVFSDSWLELLALLSAPKATMAFASAVLACVLAAGYCLLIAALGAACLPGAPFFNIEVDERFVTHRRLWDVRRRLLRDVDGWTSQLRRRMVVRHALRFEVRDYVVVAWPQGRDALRAEARGPLTEIYTALFTPLFGDKAFFAQAFADLLTAAAAAARESRRPIVLDLPLALAAQAFEPAPRRAPAYEEKAKRSSKPKAKPARMPGRFPTNEDKAAYWRGQSIQAAKADDNSPLSARANEQAYLYEQLAKRDRKRIAREKRAQRLKARQPGPGDVS